MATAATARGALVLFSGGQDSATCLAWALAQPERFAAVETVAFDYGQRHRVELACRPALLQGLREQFPHWGSRLGDDHRLDLPLLSALGGSALTEARAIELQAGALPNTFVPGRNLLFFAAAAALAYRRGLSVLVGGMCETDYSGYPDCRDNTLKALQVALSLGLDSAMTVETPLMFIDKAATWSMAERLGGPALVSLLIEHSHSCYLGDRSRRFDWGYGCGACPACELRARGHARWTASLAPEAASPLPLKGAPPAERRSRIGGGRREQ